MCRFLRSRASAARLPAQSVSQSAGAKSSPVLGWFVGLGAVSYTHLYYTLRFETGGGSAIPGVRETYNTYIDLTKYVPTRHGYTFVGWYSEQSLVNKVSDIYLTGDRTVYALSLIHI